MLEAEVVEVVDSYKYFGVMVTKDAWFHKCRRNKKSYRTREETSDETITFHFMEQSTKDRNKNQNT